MKTPEYFSIPEAMKATGLTRYRLTQLIQAGMLRPVYLTPRGRPIISRTGINRVIQHLNPAPDCQDEHAHLFE